MVKYDYYGWWDLKEVSACYYYNAWLPEPTGEGGRGVREGLGVDDIS